MDKITAKIRNYRSKVRYATRGEAEAAAKRRDARRMTALALNAFDNHRRLIWT